jgi:hypothetical protein
MWTKLFRSQVSEAERLLDWVEIVKMRVLSGMTLHQALADTPQIYASTELCYLWKRLYDRVSNAGNLSPVDALEIIHQRLKLNRNLEGLKQKKLSTPKIQNTIISILTLVFFVATQFLVSDEMRASTFTIALVSALIVVAQIWSHFIIKQLQQSLWFSDWVVALSRMEGALSWGNTFRQAFCTAFDDLNSSKWPKDLFLIVEKFSESLRSSNNFYIENETDFSGVSKKILEQLILLQRQLEKGVELLSTVRHFKQSNYESLELEIHRQVEHAQWKLMLPLFCCLLPAFFILLFAPILGIFENT